MNCAQTTPRCQALELSIQVDRAGNLSLPCTGTIAEQRWMRSSPP